MAAKTEHGTGIEWTHVPGYKGETWNPVRGCTKISPGCKHCYAETFAERWRGVAEHPYEHGFDLRLVPEKLYEPLRARKPRAYFVNSMSDLFHVGIGDDYRDKVFATMLASEVLERQAQHLYLVLTKRADVMASYFAAGPRATINRWGRAGDGRIIMDDADVWFSEYVDGQVAGRETTVLPLRNLWLGVSVEDRKYGLPRVDVLRTIPATVRFLSVEPLLEDLGDIDLTGIHWVIVGGESGPGARTFDVDWARNIIRQCRRQQVPVFLKQLGAAAMDGRNYIAGHSLHVNPDTASMVPLRRLTNRKGADESEWPEDIRGIKQWPRCVAHKG